jgi:hypothetical protein
VSETIKTCFSLYQTGNQDIPSPWAVCESGITLESSREEIEALTWYQSNYSEFSVCMKCLLKWKKFDFDQDLDYTSFKPLKSQKEIEHENQFVTPIKVKSAQEDSDILSKVTDGKALYETLQKQYLSECVKHCVS